jgi:hypothetical protein
MQSKFLRLKIFSVIATVTLLSLTLLATLTDARPVRSLVVSNVEELYLAVDDSANAGAAVVLAAGTYTLSANKPDGSPRTNAGRIELQADMSLTGVVGDRGAVVIDAAGLPIASFNLPGIIVGIVRVGRGFNTVEWLTINGVGGSVGSIDATLLSPERSVVRIAHVKSTGSSRAVDIRNFMMPDRILDAELIDNEFYGGFEGIRILNANTSTRAVITVKMNGNYLHDNEHGCIIENTRTSFGHIEVRSYGDLMTGNGTGCLIGSGFIAGAQTANSNYTLFEAHGSRFIDNTGPVFRWPGGIVAAGGMSGVANAASNNLLDIKLVGCKLYGNPGADLKVRGAFFTGVANLLAGTNNLVSVELVGASKFTAIDAADSEPFELAATNRVEIVE